MLISAVGDIFLADQPACFGFGVASHTRLHGAHGLFELVQPVLQQADLVVGNLECVIDGPIGSGLPTFHEWVNRGLPAGVAALAAAGFHAVNLANNHSFDYGPEGLHATMRCLEANGIAHFGTRSRPFHTVRVGDESVALLGWSLVPGAYDDLAGEHYHRTDRLADVLAEISSIRSAVDRVVVSLHWGNEFLPQPARRQRTIAHQLLEGVADIILGHHPHVLQPVELTDAGLVAYSLGNFIFDAWDHATRDSMILTIDTRRLKDYTAVPIQIDERSYSVVPRTDLRSTELLMQRLQTLSDIADHDYPAVVQQKRSSYRRAMLRHLLKNVRRLQDGAGIAWWLLRRMQFLISTQRKQARDPYAVYRGPVR